MSVCAPPSHRTFTANNGSALLLRLSLGYLEGKLLFESNLAQKGGAIRVLDRSRVSLPVRTCYF